MKKIITLLLIFISFNAFAQRVTTTEIQPPSGFIIPDGIPATEIKFIQELDIEELDCIWGNTDMHTACLVTMKSIDGTTKIKETITAVLVMRSCTYIATFREFKSISVFNTREWDLYNVGATRYNGEKPWVFYLTHKG